MYIVIYKSTLNTELTSFALFGGLLCLLGDFLGDFLGDLLGDILHKISDTLMSHTIIYILIKVCTNQSLSCVE